jgi:hypothetical protein
VGQDWDRATHRFTREQSYFEFGKSLAFNETKGDNGVEYTEHDITLYTRPGGNVLRQVITQKDFDRN